jgi:hypothetical protein
MRFEVAPLDKYAARITSGLAYLGGMLALPLLFAYLANLRWDGLLIPTALALALALFLLLTYALQPRAYRVETKTLIIERRLWRSLRIPLEQISGVSTAATLSDVPRYGLRFAFNPGVFGYQGPFQLEPYGRVFFIATDRRRLVAIARRQLMPLIVSPARPGAFIEALNNERTDHAVRTLENPVAETQEVA